MSMRVLGEPAELAAASWGSWIFAVDPKRWKARSQIPGKLKESKRPSSSGNKRHDRGLKWGERDPYQKEYNAEKRIWAGRGRMA